MVSYKEVDEEHQKRLSIVPYGGYMPVVDHSVPGDISFQNYVYFNNKLTKECNELLKNWKAE